MKNIKKYQKFLENYFQKKKTEESFKDVKTILEQQKMIFKKILEKSIQKTIIKETKKLEKKTVVRR